MSSYSKTLRYLYGLERFGIKPGLERISAVLKRLKDPHLDYPSVHIAGTNGKGSTAAMIESILTEAGMRTGLYTSPHLVRFNERIRVCRTPLSDPAVVKTFKAVRRAAVRLNPTFFEFSTAMAFTHFSEKKVDAAVVEAGMGGRLDATNIITPLVSVITGIGLEHTEHLGSTIEKIASEKAGIIKEGGAAVTTEVKRAPLAVIRKAAEKKGAALLMLGKDFGYTEVDAARGIFDYHGLRLGLKSLRLNLLGAHQFKNASAALAVVEVLCALGLKISEAAIRRGLKKTFWPGRLERICRRPLVILDAAHNPQGAAALRDALRFLKRGRLTLVAGIMADKDIAGIFRELAPAADSVILTSASTGRAAPVGLLEERLRPYGVKPLLIPSVEEACAAAIEVARPVDTVCVTGSVYTVGEARGFLLRYLVKGRPLC